MGNKRSDTASDDREHLGTVARTFGDRSRTAYAQSMTTVFLGRPKLRPVPPEDMLDHEIHAGDFVGITSDKSRGVWSFDGSQIAMIGVHQHDHRSSADVSAGRTLRDALAGVPAFQGANFVLHKMILSPGGFYPRIARPSDQHPEEAPGYLPNFAEAIESLVSSLNQVRSLMHMLNNLFQSIHPNSANMACYGAGVRNLLLLACTECETQWRAVLTANGYEAARFTTQDFVKLLPAMRLDEYAVRLQHCPWLPAISPFAGWKAANPTKSLHWYDDYNAAKHDRETNFARASLGSAIASVAGVWVMIAASYGLHGLRHFVDVDHYFTIEYGPRWRYSEVYTHPYAHGLCPNELIAQNYPF